MMLPCRRGARPRIKIGEQHGKNAGQEYAVKGSGAADRSDRRAQATHLVEVGEIGPNQRAEAASNIGKRRAVSRESRIATIAVTTTGTNTGTAMPRPETG
jgi:hypothetical protein